MNLADQQKLVRLFNDGYTVTIKSDYISGEVMALYCDDNGGYSYDDYIYEGRELDFVHVSDVEVYKVFTDWQGDIL